jgi:metal-sulfur cluster biosynthetic enzyme
MAGDPVSGATGEARYAERSDDAEKKMALLRAARKRGDYRLAVALADSLKDGLAAEWRLAGGAPAAVDLAASAWLPVAALPGTWAPWASGWSWVQPVTLRESAGIARHGEPVDVLVCAPVAWCASLTRELRVAEVDGETGTPCLVPCQVYDEERSRATGDDTRSAHLVWRASVPARGAAHYLVFAGNPAAELPSYASDLATRGQGVALEIENAHYVASLSRQTGQLERLRYKRAHGLELFAGGEGHGEPPHIDWAHDYLADGKFQKFRVTNWETVRNYEVVRGPVCTLVRRWGFPHSPLHPVFTAARMLVDVTYTFYAGAPYFLKDGTMRAVQDFSLNYLRDDEWVFSGYSFTDLLWLDKDGRAHEGAVPAQHASEMWGVGFFHQKSRDAFVALRLEHRLHPERDVRLYHADAPSLDYKGHGQLWSRWALRGDPRLRAGDTLSQRNAYVVEAYAAEGGASRLEEWRRKLLAPLVVEARGEPVAPTRPGEPHGTLAGPGETPADGALKAAVWDAMGDVPDDMFYTVDANVVDMGYVYDVRVRHGGDVEVLLTMPHRGRPHWRYLGRPIELRLAQVPGVRSTLVTPVWEPAWTPHRMSDAGWRAMGLEER